MEHTLCIHCVRPKKKKLGVLISLPTLPFCPRLLKPSPFWLTVYGIDIWVTECTGYLWQVWHFFKMMHNSWASQTCIYKVFRTETLGSIDWSHAWATGWLAQEWSDQFKQCFCTFPSHRVWPALNVQNSRPKPLLFLLLQEQTVRCTMCESVGFSPLCTVKMDIPSSSDWEDN